MDSVVIKIITIVMFILSGFMFAVIHMNCVYWLSCDLYFILSIVSFVAAALLIGVGVDDW